MDEQAVGMMVGYMLESVVVVAFVESLVLNLPAGFGTGVERP